MSASSSTYRLVIPECAALTFAAAVVSGLTASSLFGDLPASAELDIVIFAVLVPLLLGTAHICHILIRTGILEKQRNRWRRRAVRDRLTGLDNRLGFKMAWNARASVEARGDSAGSGTMLLILDADHFKRINDRFGHPVGDQVLKVIAQTTVRTLRESDICGRMGGEEFAVAVLNVSMDQGRKIAERIRRNIAALSIPVKGERLQLTISIGGVFDPLDKTGFDALYRLADANCYRSKRGGRNRVTLSTATKAPEEVGLRDLNRGGAIPSRA